MVRYNIAALTNSHVTIKGEGGTGQTIWAVNNTGGDIVQGDKVWINTDLTEQVHSKNIFRSSRGVPTGFIKNNIYYGPNSMFIWNGSDYDTVNFASSDTIFRDTKPYRIENNIVIQMGQNVLIDESNQAIVVSCGQTDYRPAILNEKYVCSESTEYNLGIREYNIKNGALVSNDIIYNFDPEYFQYPICFFNKKKLVLSRISNAKGLRIFDDFTATTPTFTDYPTTDSFYCVWFTNEDNIGSYAIGVENGVINGSIEQFVSINSKAWTIYKFNADGTLTFPDDLPTSLTTWLHVDNVCFTYNTQEGILCAIRSSQNRYGAWKLVNGKFVDIPLPEYINPEGGSIIDKENQAFYISSDLKTLAINAAHKDFYTYQRTDVYRYNTIDGKWYATSPAWRDNNTLTGIATGETNSEGLYEIAVALPDKVSLTFNITPDEDSIEFKGVVA